ncbi:conserved hypothetical protein [Neospora caninum Liverpool]|uniref:Uncharacterized protein n=1 Tax=Neospora caninum (strain Liverpool) TaxID=572307 RepID=F0VHQ5_NEOCL|nr:conserved hypothetical protein [Neospora caninum Liverpool]CBZ53266.1 conserved hypothetical protein [Neospora caninum Liverpool]CEL67252.1 TPA: hypothetical protein BN1204_030530 [Neospora caninum Liverpool]|eukprot:XP_003883298.1 conserved hypothetical protein [Neospora caninum Liverpool]
MPLSHSFHRVQKRSVFSSSVLNDCLPSPALRCHDRDIPGAHTSPASPQASPHAMSMELVRQSSLVPPLASSHQCAAAPHVSSAAVAGGALAPGFFPTASSGVVHPSSSLLLSSAPPPMQYNAFHFSAAVPGQQAVCQSSATSSWGPGAPGAVATHGSSQLSGAPFLPVFLPSANAPLYVSADSSGNVLSAAAVPVCVSSSIDGLETGRGISQGDGQRGAAPTGSPLAGRDDAALVGLDQGAGGGACVFVLFLLSPSVYSLLPQQQQHVATAAVYEHMVRGVVPYGLQSSEQAYWTLASSRNLHPALCGVPPSPTPLLAQDAAASISQDPASEAPCVDSSQDGEGAADGASEPALSSQIPLAPAVPCRPSLGKHAEERGEWCDQGDSETVQGQERDSPNAQKRRRGGPGDAVTPTGEGREGARAAAHGHEEARATTPNVEPAPASSSDCSCAASVRASGSPRTRVATANAVVAKPDGVDADRKGEDLNRDACGEVGCSCQEAAPNPCGADPGGELLGVPRSPWPQNALNQEAAVVCASTSGALPSERGIQDGRTRLGKDQEGSGGTQVSAKSFIQRKRGSLRGLPPPQRGARLGGPGQPFSFEGLDSSLPAPSLSRGVPTPPFPHPPPETDASFPSCSGPPATPLQAQTGARFNSGVSPNAATPARPRASYFPNFPAPFRPHVQPTAGVSANLGSAPYPVCGPVAAGAAVPVSSEPFLAQAAGVAEAGALRLAQGSVAPSPGGACSGEVCTEVGAGGKAGATHGANGRSATDVSGARILDSGVEAVNEACPHALPPPMSHLRDSGVDAVSDASASSSTGSRAGPLRSVREARTPSIHGASSGSAWSARQRGILSYFGIGPSEAPQLAATGRHSPQWGAETLPPGSVSGFGGEGGKANRERGRRSCGKVNRRDRESVWPLGRGPRSQETLAPLSAVPGRRSADPSGIRRRVASVSLGANLAAGPGRERARFWSAHGKESLRERRRLQNWREVQRSVSVTPGNLKSPEERADAWMDRGAPDLPGGLQEHSRRATRPKRRTEGQVNGEQPWRALGHGSEEAREQVEEGRLWCGPENRTWEGRGPEGPTERDRWRGSDRERAGRLSLDVSGCPAPPLFVPPSMLAPGQRQARVSETREIPREPIGNGNAFPLWSPVPDPPQVPSASAYGDVSQLQRGGEVKEKKTSKRNHRSRGWAVPVSPCAARSPLLSAPPPRLRHRVPAGPPLPAGAYPPSGRPLSLPCFGLVPVQPPPPLPAPPAYAPSAQMNAQPPMPPVSPRVVWPSSPFPRRPVSLAAFSPVAAGHSERAQTPASRRDDGCVACSLVHYPPLPLACMPVGAEGSGEERRSGLRPRQGLRKGEPQDSRRRREAPVPAEAEPNLRWCSYGSEAGGVSPSGAVASRERLQKQEKDAARVERSFFLVDRDERNALCPVPPRRSTSSTRLSADSAPGPGVAEGEGLLWPGGMRHSTFCVQRDGEAAGTRMHAGDSEGRQEGKALGPERQTAGWRLPALGPMPPWVRPADLDVERRRGKAQAGRLVSEGRLSAGSSNGPSAVEAPRIPDRRGDRDRGARTYQTSGQSDRQSTQGDVPSPLPQTEREVYVRPVGLPTTEGPCLGSFGAEHGAKGGRGRRGRGERVEGKSGNAFGSACTYAEPTHVEGKAVRACPGTGVAIAAQEYAPGRDGRQDDRGETQRSGCAKVSRRVDERMHHACSRVETNEGTYRLQGRQQNDVDPGSRKGNEVCGAVARGARRHKRTSFPRLSHSCAPVLSSSLASPFSVSLTSMTPSESLTSCALSPSSSSGSFYTSPSISSFSTVSSASSIYPCAANGGFPATSWSTPVSSPCSAVSGRGGTQVQSEETPFVRAHVDATHLKNFSPRLPSRPRPSVPFLPLSAPPYSLQGAPVEPSALFSRPHAFSGNAIARRHTGSEGDRRGAGEAERVNGRLEVEPRTCFFSYAHKGRGRRREHKSRDEEAKAVDNTLATILEGSRVLEMRRRPVRH